MVSDGEAVSLVVNAGDELGEVGMRVEGEGGGGGGVGGRIGGVVGGIIGGVIGGEEELDSGVAGVVAGFVAAEEGDVMSLEKGTDGVDLRGAAVKDDKIGIIPFSVLEATSEDFLEAGGVVVLLAAELELAIFGTIGDAVDEHDHGTDDILAGLVGNVVAFNAAGRLREVEEVLELGEGAIRGDVHEFFVRENDFLLEFPEAVELLAEGGGGFIVLSIGGGAHLLLKLTQEFVAAALEVKTELAQVLLVFLRSGFADFDAWGEAEVGVEGFLAGVGLVVVGEDFAEDAEGFLDGSFAVEGADVGGAVVLGSASEADIGDFGFEVDADVGDGFVVAK